MGRAHELWRQAALDHQLQFYDEGYDPINPVDDYCTLMLKYSDGTEGLLFNHLAKNSHCAMTLLWYKIPLHQIMTWECPECHVQAVNTARSWMIHMNNIHKWDWLTFANKFPEFEDARE